MIGKRRIVLFGGNNSTAKNNKGNNEKKDDNNNEGKSSTYNTDNKDSQQPLHRRPLLVHTAEICWLIDGFIHSFTIHNNNKRSQAQA